MRLFHVVDFYSVYLRAFYKSRPELLDSSRSSIVEALLEDGFSSIHLMTLDLRNMGYEVELVISNDPVSQPAWAQENRGSRGSADRKTMGPTGSRGQALNDELLGILIRQINDFEPDILYIDDPVGLDTRFISMLKKRPRLVIAWRAASIPFSCDWSDFDVIVSNHTPSLRLAKRRGARWQEFLQPGFPAWIDSACMAVAEENFALFSGSITREHRTRLRVLRELPAALEKFKSPIGLTYQVNNSELLPEEIKLRRCEPVWGMDMYRSLKRAKINLNIHIDLAGREAANMRMFEATGLGCFLITDYKPNISEYFETGKEIETFRSVDELAEKIRYYSENDIERRAIAEAGQRRCRDRFSRTASAERFDQIVCDALAAKEKYRFNRGYNLRRLLPGLNRLSSGNCR